MLRRPLVRLSDTFDLVSRLTGPQIALPQYLVHAPESLYTYPDLPEVARAVGLPELPAKKKMLTDRREGQHPTTFLQLGWMTDEKRQTAFEMGDAGMILSLHFRKASPGQPQSPWHLDVVEIDDGRKELGQPVTFHIPCDEELYKPHMAAVFRASVGVVTLFTQGDAMGAADCFHDVLTPVIRELDTMSEVMAADHEFEFREKFGDVQPQRGLRL